MIQKILCTFAITAVFTAVLFAQPDSRQYVSRQLRGASPKQLYPGDTAINVTYYKLDLTLSYTPQYLRGSVTIGFRFTQNNQTTCRLELDPTMTIDSIVSGGASLAFARTADQIEIGLPGSHSVTETNFVVVYYQGVPGSTGFGSFTFGTHASSPCIYSLSEPYGSKDWWPCKDTPADKADSADIIITAPSFFVSVSNGSLRSTVTNPNGTTTYAWHVSYPIAPYLISLAMTNYSLYTTYYRYSATDSMPITHYIYPESLSGAKLFLDKTANMIAIFSSRFGQYPFLREKYGHAQFGWSGGMEHQTITSLGGFSDNLIAHELCHQWYGDMATCAAWGHIWLNEGFATYGEAVYYEAVGGASNYQQYINQRMINARSAVGSLYVQDISDQNSIFNYARSYAKGCVVLHMLRGVLGDSVFFRVMREYLLSPAGNYSSATTENFKEVAEQVSGKTLGYFFSEWIYGENYPKYAVTWSAVPVGGAFRADVNISQQTNTVPAFFTMPVELKFSNDLRDTTVLILNNAPAQLVSVSLSFDPTTLTFDPNMKIMKSVTVSNLRDVIYRPADFHVFPNYPNPFNGGTSFSFRIGHGSDVTLRVYDILGNEVYQSDRTYFTPGNHTLRFEPDNLPAGTYFYELRAGELNGKGKMIYLK